MQLTRLLAAGLIPGMVSARTLSRRGVDCGFSTTADSGATCESFAGSWGLSVDDFKKLNPGVTCPGLDTSKSYCVIGTVTNDPPTTTSTQRPSTTLKTSTTTKPSTTTKSSTTTSAPSPSNSPAMPGLAGNCDGFYKVASGDQCDIIAQKNGISMAQFRSWNSEINAECSNLWLGYYVCVHVPGAATPSTTTSAPSPSNSPAMPGLAGNCDGFYKVASGDQCDAIAQKNGISTAQFRSWNSYINAECSNLWLGYYVCVHVPGAATTTQGPTGQPSGPTPQMPGIVANCKSFYQVKSGDGCWSIYTSAGISFDQFRSWNKQIDAGCTNLWLGYYVCVGV